MAFPMIAASLFSLPLSTYSYAALSRVDQVYTHVFGSYTTMDVPCTHSLRNKCNHCKPKSQWILDSSASMHFSPERDNFVKYTTFPKKNHIPVHTAANSIYIVGISKCIVPWRDSLDLFNMGCISNSGIWLVSMCQLVASNTTVQGDRSSICMLYGDGTLLAPFTPLPHFGWYMYTLKVATSCDQPHTITYDMMHQQLRYPFKDVLKYVHDYMCNFPNSLKFPKEDTICPGYVKDKMLAHTYYLGSCCTSKPSELIHLDIKSFPILFYHKY